MQAFIKKFVENLYFKGFILLTILGAGFNIGLQTYTATYQKFQHISDTADTVILWIFIIEIVLKMVAESPKPWRFFKDSWNVFDFVIVALCLLPINGQFFAVMRMFRLFRVLRLISVLPQLRLLVHTLIKSIPSIGNIMILLILHFYIYGAIATIFFSENDPLHFGNLHTSILSLFRAVTLEDWTDLMYINMYGCDQYGYDGVRIVPCDSPVKHPVFSPLFFVSFVLTGSMIVLNLFIGVIMTGMEEGRAEVMVRELTEKKAQGTLGPHEEIVLIEAELQELSKQMRTLNSRLFQLLENVKKHY